ncbi:MAG: MMPL family transporter [Conexivisphaerales archaeon]
MATKHLPSLDGLFDAYSRLVVKYRKQIVIFWIAAIIVSIPLAIESNSIVSYSINVPTSNNESKIAEDIVSSQFPHYQQPNVTYYIIIQGQNVLAPSFYNNYKQLNLSLYSHLSMYGIKSVDSVYSFEYSLLKTTFSNVTSYVNNTLHLINSTYQALRLVSNNLTEANSQEYMIYSNAQDAVNQVTNLSQQLNSTNHAIYQLQNRINQTSYMLYGIPQGFAKTWSALYYSPQGSYMSMQQLNQAANSTFVSSSGVLSMPYPSPLYYSIFFSSWSHVTNSLTPSYVSSNIQQVTSESANMTIQALLPNLNSSEVQFVSYVASSFNLTDYFNPSILRNATLNLALNNASATQTQIVRIAYGLGPNASYASAESAALSLITSSLPINQANFVQSAFEASKTEGLTNFTIQYFVNQLNSTYPSLSSKIASDYNVTIQEFAAYAFDAGNPPDINAVDNSSVLLVSRAIETNQTIVHLLRDQFNFTTSSFVTLALNSKNESMMKQNAIDVVARGIAYQTSKVFYLDYNYSAIRDVIYRVYNGSVQLADLPDSLLSNYAFPYLPVVPDEGFRGQFVSPSMNTTIAIVTFNSTLSSSGQQQFENVIDSMNSTGFRTHFTATEILNNDVRDIISESERVALPFGLVVALLVAGIFFLSPVSAFIPLIMFGVSIEVGFALVDLFLGHLQGERLSYISPIIISVLGLGLASDYVVLIMNRFKQELKSDKFEAAKTSARWAGEAVFTSALTVIMSYLALSLSGIPLFSDVGSANVIVVTVILLSSLTFLPALLSILGNRVFWPRRSAATSPSRLSTLTKKSLSHPKTVVSILVVITILSVVFAISLPVNIDFLSLAPNTPAKQGLDQITNNFGGSLLLPEYVVVQLPSPVSTGNNTFNTSILSTLKNIEDRIRAQQGVTSVFSAISPFNESIPYQQLNSMQGEQRLVISQLMMNYFSSDNRTTYMKVVFSGNPFSDKVLDEANIMQQSLSGSYGDGYRILVGGISTDSYGVLQYVFQVLPKIILVLIAAIFVVLFLQLRSVFTPLRLIATILSSVSWTLALVWLIFYHISGLSIYIFAPLFLVTTMLGVGMDYDIFLITRVREEVVKGKDDPQAIVVTSETTGGVIVALGLILGSVFFGLVLTQVRLLQQIGLTLTFGVLLDTLVVWMMFVPAIMVLAKKLNWWPGNPRKNKKNEIKNHRAQL